MRYEFWDSSALEFRKALTDESDRGCVLFAAAYLDAKLSDLLYVSLVTDRDIEEELFKGNSPLSTFSSRIKMAFYLGLISKACRKNLDTIRSIRNHCAHKLDVNPLSDQSIRDQCKSLSFSYHEKQEDPRSHFTAAVMLVLARIQVATLVLTPHVEKPDDTPSEDCKASQRQYVEEAVNKLLQLPGRIASGEQFSVTDAELEPPKI